MDKARKEMLAGASSDYTESIFESIKHVNEYGVEFWYARELQAALEYKEWRNFYKVMNRAVIACKTVRMRWLIILLRSTKRYACRKVQQKKYQIMNSHAMPVIL